MRCKICGSNQYDVIGNPRVNMIFPNPDHIEYAIAQCNQCSFYFLVPEISLTQAQWTKLYENDYFSNQNVTEWQKKLHDKERKSRLSLISKFSKSEKGPFLDIGCGEGFVLNEALKYNYMPYGLDIASNLNPSIESEKIEFFNGNIFEAEYNDNFFKAIYIDSVLEHVTEPMSVLAEIFRILKPGGVGFIIVPNEDCLLNDVKKILYTMMRQKNKYGRIKPFYPPYHINGFNQKSLRFALLKTGFNILQLSQFGGNYRFWKAHQPLSQAYFRELILFPFGLLSVFLNKQMQLQVVVTK